MSDCLFCKIVEKRIPARILFENDELIAFHDVNPQAPMHALVIPKRHIRSLADADPEDCGLLGALMIGAQRAAKELGIDESGYRVVANTGADGGQSVFHIHFHVLGGRPLAWPPG
jgi:histidine triad (HIT) family protein